LSFFVGGDAVVSRAHEIAQRAKLRGATSFTRSQLLAMVGSTTTLTFDLRGGDVRYVVTATLTVRGVRGTCVP
jgi:hypothetical protein